MNLNNIEIQILEEGKVVQTIIQNNVFYLNYFLQENLKFNNNECVLTHQNALILRQRLVEQFSDFNFQEKHNNKYKYSDCGQALDILILILYQYSSRKNIIINLVLKD